MIGILKLFIVQAAIAAPPSPMPLPIFLKAGYSSIIEFEQAPTQLVLGDADAFQIEKIDKSIVIKPLASYASTNMFVYFKNLPPKLLLLNASEDVEPTLFKKIEQFSLPKENARLKSSPVPKVRQPSSGQPQTGVSLTRKSLDRKGDYLTLDVSISAGSGEKVVPDWDLVRLKFKDRVYTPTTSWAQRREVQRGTNTLARFVFVKTNTPPNLHSTRLVIPLKSSPKSLTLDLGAKRNEGN